MIEARNLYKRYRSKVAVDDLSFTIESGRITGFLGPNGSGKSTTMRLMLGLDNGGGGTAYDGAFLHDYANPMSVVGILLEAKAFHPTRTARNHLRVLAAASGIADSRVDEVLDIVGLKDVAKKGPGKFSLGMAQRLGIAAAILAKPKYLFLDEPANGLDPEGMHWLRGFMKDYAANGGSVFVSSHLLSEISLMADDLVVIGKGKLLAAKSMNELLATQAQNAVFIRSNDIQKLQAMLSAAQLTFDVEGEGFVVKGVTQERLAELAQQGNLLLTELSARKASLEDAFLDITADTTEFNAQKSENK